MKLQRVTKAQSTIGSHKIFLPYADITEQDWGMEAPPHQPRSPQSAYKLGGALRAAAQESGADRPLPALRRLDGS